VAGGLDLAGAGAVAVVSRLAEQGVAVRPAGVRAWEAAVVAAVSRPAERAAAVHPAGVRAAAVVAAVSRPAEQGAAARPVRPLMSVWAPISQLSQRVRPDQAARRLPARAAQAPRPQHLPPQ
jgi:hypothetical protein